MLQQWCKQCSVPKLPQLKKPCPHSAKSPLGGSTLKDKTISAYKFNAGKVYQNFT